MNVPDIPRMVMEPCSAKTIFYCVFALHGSINIGLQSDYNLKTSHAGRS